MSLLCDFAINYLSNVGWYLQDNKMQVFIKNLSITLFNVIQFSNTLCPRRFYKHRPWPKTDESVVRFATVYLSSVCIEYLNHVHHHGSCGEGQQCFKFRRKSLSSDQHCSFNLILLSSSDPAGVQLRSFMNTALYTMIPLSLCLLPHVPSAGKKNIYKALTMLLSFLVSPS